MSKLHRLEQRPIFESKNQTGRIKSNSKQQRATITISRWADKWSFITGKKETSLTLYNKLVTSIRQIKGCWQLTLKVKGNTKMLDHSLSFSDNGDDLFESHVFFSMTLHFSFVVNPQTILLWGTNTEESWVGKNTFLDTVVCTLLLLLSYPRRLFLTYSSTTF